MAMGMAEGMAEAMAEGMAEAAAEGMAAIPLQRATQSFL